MSQNSSLEPPLPLSSQPAVDRSRPHTTAVLAMSADGKIADAHHGAARFPSPVDKAHLEVQVAKADATLFGAGTLRAYGTTLPVTNPELIAQRRSRHQLDQPSQIVCSATGNLDPHYRFFQQPVPPLADHHPSRMADLASPSQSSFSSAKPI
ncbi:MAG: hypothetical protein HC800_15790 [Phormidesmis sp. RL_2_1]|nr:hypothetical protein [Phormidesmis sp. RL_2_1]